MYGYSRDQWMSLPSWEREKAKERANKRPVADPDGAKVRQLLPNAALPPSLADVDWQRQPDGSYGMPPPMAQQRPVAESRAFSAAPSGQVGMTWLPGYGYVPSDSPVVRQMEQGMDMERQRMDLEREKLAMEREQMKLQGGLGADLRGWLAKRLGGAA